MHKISEQNYKWGLSFLNEESEYIEIPREKYERLEVSVKEMNAPYQGALDFIHTQIDKTLEKYDSWLEENEEREKRRKNKNERG